MSKTIKVPDVPAPKAKLCWKQNALMHRCDRRAGHLGPHTWEFPTWQPIETAPKDGTPIVVYSYGMQYVVRWLDKWCVPDSRGMATELLMPPSCWMPLSQSQPLHEPLPAPPARS